MPLIYGVILVLLVALGVVSWLLYGALVRNGRTLLRLQAVQRQLAQPESTEILKERWLKLFHPFDTGGQFEYDNIFVNILGLDEYQIQQERFQPGDVILDVGANVGSFTLLCHMLGSRAIFAYEPGEQNFQLLKRNVGTLPGIHVFPAAVWRSDQADRARLSLLEAQGNAGAHTVMAKEKILGFAHQNLSDPARPAYPVEAVSLDSILEGFNRVRLLKLDCEGSEFPSLLTSQRLERVQRIVGEIHEFSDLHMQGVEDRGRVPGHPAYRREVLVSRLQSLGFAVSVRPGDANMCWFDARREARAGI